MKKVFGILCAVSLLLTAGCGVKKPSVESAEQPSDTTIALEKETVTKSPDGNASEISDKGTWKAQYAAYLTPFLSDHTIFAAYVGDVDGDGVPMVAISYKPTIMKIADLLLNWSDGKLVVADYGEENHQEGSGSALFSKSVFVDGTNYMIYRAVGGHQSTLGANYLRIYDIVNGHYELIKEHSVDLEKYANEDPQFFYAEFGGMDYQRTLVNPEFDRIITETCGSSKQLVFIENGSMSEDEREEEKSADCAVLFDVPYGEETDNAQGIAYLEKQLGIDLG